jgi:3'-5' exoribonuclease
MPRRFINQLGEREAVDEIFLASEKQLRPNRNGNLYLQLRLSDRTGTVNAMMWNANEGIYQAFENGDFVHVQGTAQVYNGNLQIIVNQIDAAEPRNINADDFVHLSDAHLANLLARLRELLRSMDDRELKQLAECFFDDEPLMRRFAAAPAGIKHHHAYPGGLLEHVVQLMTLIQSVTPHYPRLNADLLLMGGFLHDIGKIDELLYDRGLAYSDEGQLIGHLVQGVSILERKLQDYERRQGEAFSEPLAMQLKHMIVSHHGKLEFGSPKVPMTLEAMALHYLDDMDAKLHSFEQLMRDDANVDSAWTVYHAQLGRKLFKSDKAMSPE